MAQQLFLNLACKDLPASIKFFETLGYSFNPQFTDETATCMIISNSIQVMLLTREKFTSFSPNPLCDAKEANEVLIALSCESRQDVDNLVAKAVAAGGNTYSEPQDHGFMYAHGFQDLDGHVWEVFFMEAAPPQ